MTEQEASEFPRNPGYEESFTQIEYGVFADRREHGIGVVLLDTVSSAELADRIAAKVTSYPTFIRQRLVLTSVWHPTPSGEERSQ